MKINQYTYIIYLTTINNLQKDNYDQGSSIDWSSISEGGYINFHFHDGRNQAQGFIRLQEIPITGDDTFDETTRRVSLTTNICLTY